MDTEPAPDVFEFKPHQGRGFGFPVWARSYRLCRPRMITLLSVVANLIAFAALLSIRTTADEATKKRFLSEYPAASKSLQARFENVSVRFESQIDPRGLKTEGIYRRSNGYEKAEVTQSMTKREQYIEVSQVFALRNFRPLFHIFKDSTKSPQFEHWGIGDDSYTPGGIFRTLRQAPSFLTGFRALYRDWTEFSWTNRTIMSFSDICGSYVYAPWGLGIVNITTLMSKPTFVLLDADPVPGEPGIVEVRFRANPGARPIEHVVRFDTENHWAVVSAALSYVNSPKRIMEMHVEYEPERDGFALPSVVRYGNDPAVRFSEWSFEPTPADEFRVSHYGLEEPFFSTFGYLVWVVLALVGAIFAVFAALFIRRRRKRRFIT